MYRYIFNHFHLKLLPAEDIPNFHNSANMVGNIQSYTKHLQNIFWPMPYNVWNCECKVRRQRVKRITPFIYIYIFLFLFVFWFVIEVVLYAANEQTLAQFLIGHFYNVCVCVCVMVMWGWHLGCTEVIT